MSDADEVRVEATGETVGEAKWAALRELEKLIPGLERERVEFQVVTEGERGLLGVGYAPAHVVAVAPAGPGPSAAQSEEAAAAREFVERVAAGIGAAVTTVVREDEDLVTVTCTGSDLGLFIGKHGQTIDAIQYLANAIARASGWSRGVLVDAAGYRARRTAALEATAHKAARRAAATGSRIGLDPMTAVERKIVHETLKDDPEIETVSEGSEPNRYVVLVPRRLAG